MNCDEARRCWNLYHDSEGDAALHLHINEHLESCPACAEWFFKQSHFEDHLAQHLAPQPADPQLWQLVLEKAGVITPVARPKSVSSVMLLACVAAVLVMAVTLGILGMTSPSQSSPSLSAQAASWHGRLAGGREAIPFQSDIDHDVEAYLREQVPFPVRCPPRKDAGFAVEGAGTCRLADESVAYLIGNVDKTPVSIFILSRDSLAAFPHQAAALRRERVHRCREGKYEMALSVIDRNLVVVIGQTRGEELIRVLRAYGTYPHSPPG